MGDDIEMEVEDNRMPLKKTYAKDNVYESSRNSRFQPGEGGLYPNNFAKFR